MIIDSGIVTGSLQVSGSFSVSGSTTLVGPINIVSGSISGSIDSASFASTASYVNTLNQSLVLVTGDLQTTSTLFATTGSISRLIVDRLTVNPVHIITGSIESAISASLAQTASVAPNYLPLAGGTITGDLVVAGTASISYLNATFESASIIYSSGSNIFGDASNDTQTLYGTVDIKNGPVLVTGSLNVSNGITANLTGTASFAATAQNAISASEATLAQTANTASFAVSASAAAFATNADTASYVTLAQTASYVQQAQNAFTASIASTADNANTASYVALAQSASYVLNAQNAYSASTALFANTASYILQAQSASYAAFAGQATLADTASSADNFEVRGVMGVGGPVDGQYQVYISTSIDDGTLALDSSADINAMYFLKGGLKKFEISLDMTAASPIYRLLPYTSSGYFEIGNPSNAGSDYVFISEAVHGNVLLGPGIPNGTSVLAGALSTDKVQINGDTFVSGGLKVLEDVIILGNTGISSSLAVTGSLSVVGGITGSLFGTASQALNAVSASYAPDTTFPYTGSAVISGSLQVTGSQTVTGSLDVAGNTTVTGSLTTAGTIQVSGSLNTTGSTVLSGSLQVTGSQTITGSLDIAGNTTVTGSLTAAGAIQISGSLNATGSTVLSGSLQVTGSQTITGSLDVAGNITTTGSLTTAGTIQISGSLNVTGSTVLSGSLEVTGSQTITGSLTVAGAITASAISSPILQNGGQYFAQDTNSQITVIQNGLQTWGFYPGGQFYPAGPIAGASFGSNELTLTANAPAQLKGSLYGAQILVSSDQSGKYVWSFDAVTGNLIAPTASSFIGTASVAIDAPYYVTTASYNASSSSLSTRTTDLEFTASTLTAASASFGTQLNGITGVTGSYATTASNTFTGTQYINNTTDATSFTSTAALYTDGGMRVTKDAYVSGGLYVAGNLTIYGTASVNYVTTSVFVGLEYINLNTELPALRYAGINVGDSGSAAGISSSFWYDSEKDNWIYVYAAPNSAQQTSSLAINGPITYNNVGNEQGLTANYITKGQLVTADNNHHITSSQIYDDGTTVTIAGNLQVTGSLYAGNLTGSLNGSNLVVGSVGNDRLTNSTISGIALGSNLATLTIGTGLSGTSYNGSTGVTIANTGVTAFNTRTGGVSLQASDISGLGAGIFSGSAQIPNTSITNAQLANSAVTFNGSTVSLGGSATITANTTNTLTIGTGLSGTSFNGSGAVTIANTGVLSITTNTGLSTNSSATGNVTITNTGVTSNVAGTGISVSGATGAVTITNTGVTSAVAGTGVGVSGATGAVTFSIGQAVATSSNVQFNSLGVGTAGSGTTGEIRATADITAFYSSDERLKEDITPIENPIEKLMAIKGVTFSWKEGFDDVHSHKGTDTGVIAQDIEAIDLPDTVTTRENGFKAVKYEKLNALLIEGFKAQQKEINELKELVNTLLNK